MKNRSGAMTVLGVDARWMVGGLRGMGSYAHALVRPIREEVIHLLPAGAAIDGGRFVAKGPGFYPYWEQLILPRLCTDQGIEELLCPYNTAPLRVGDGIRLTLVVHDLIYLESWQDLRPSISLYQSLGRIYRRWCVPRVIKHADRLVAVSEYTKNQISSRFSVPREKITVIPNTVADEWLVDAPLPLSRRGDYILTVSGEAPSKNLQALIHAYGTLKKRGQASQSLPALRVVGVKPQHHGKFFAIAHKHGVEDLLRFDSYLPDSELRRIYQEARLLVVPSLYEGFGIPLLEAMASGTPIACSNSTSLPEVLGDAGWLFNPRDVVDISRVLSSALADDDLWIDYARRGLDRVKRYRYSVVSAQIKEFWGR